MEHVVILNLVGILCVAALGAFFADEDERGFTFLAVAWFAFVLSCVGWLIFVAAHFVSKYW